MGLKKFRKIRAQDEEYINVSVVCNNYNRINHGVGSPTNIINPHSDYVESSRYACMMLPITEV